MCTESIYRKDECDYNFSLTARRVQGVPQKSRLNHGYSMGEYVISQHCSDDNTSNSKMSVMIATLTL